MRRTLVSAAALMMLLTTALSASPAAPPGPPLRLLATDSSVSAPQPTRFTVGTYSGISYGMAKELVYYSGTGFSNYKVSELDWPLRPSYYVGATLGLEASSGFAASVDLRTGIPTSVGYMQDSDYLNGDGVRTNFSQHTARLERALAAVVDLGWRVPAGAGLSVEAFSRFSYRDLKWSANNGYLQYPPESAPPYTPWSASEPKYYLYGLVGLYQQSYLIPAVGINLRYQPDRRLSVAASVAYSPLASINDIDNHVLRGLIFYDSMTSATYLEPQLTLRFSPTSRFGITLRAAYLSVTSPKNGVIRTEDTTTGTTTSSAGTGSTAGASLQSYSISLGFHVSP